jgi:hypothetical protein
MGTSGVAIPINLLPTTFHLVVVKFHWFWMLFSLNLPLRLALKPGPSN